MKEKRFSALLPRPRQQQTIVNPVSVNGFGFWSGRDVRIEFRPGAVNTGHVFVRTDLEAPVRIPALVSNRIESPRRTTLSANGASVEMVEHVMAALSGLQIDNCEIHVDAPEMPGMDGSSQPFVDALTSMDLVKQVDIRPYLVVSEVTRVGNDESWIEARPAETGEFRLQYRLDYGPENPIGRESFRSKITKSIFMKELAPARTFILEHEAEWLRQQGLAQRVTAKDLLVFGETGLIDNELRYDEECARHKAMDMIGDLSLGGCDLYGQFVAYRSGHELNTRLLSILLSECQIYQAVRQTA